MATTVYDPKTGAPVTLDDNEAAEAVKAGAVGFLQDQPVRVVLPDGRTGRAPADRIGSLLAKGYRLETDEERTERTLQEQRGGPLDQAGAAALSVTDAVLPGAAGAIASLGGGLASVAKGGEFGPGAAMGRGIAGEVQEANPLSSAAGSVAGTVAGAVAGVGLPGLANKVNAGVKGAIGATSALGRVGASGLAGAAEGGLYGLGQFIGETAISENPELSAEKLFAHVGGGAVTGGILSAAGRGLLEAGKGAAGAIAKATGSGSLRGWLDETANRVAVRQFARKTDLKHHGLTPDEIQVVGDYGLKRGVFDPVGGVDAAFDNAEALRIKEGDVLGRILAQIDRKGTGFDPNRFVARARKEVVDELERRPALSAEYNKLKGILQDWQALGGSDGTARMSFAEVWQNRSDLLKRAKLGGDLAPVKAQLHKLEDVLTQEVYDQAAEVAGPAAKWLKGASRRYRNAKVLRDVAANQIERNTGNNLLGLSDMGAVAMGMVAAGPAGAALGVAHHLAKTRGGSALAVAMKRLAGSPTLSGVEKSLHRFVTAGLAAAPVWGGPFRAALMSASAEGAAELMGVHTRLAQTDPTYLGAVGLEQESPEDAAAYSGKIDRLDTVAGLLSQVDERADRELGRITGTTPGRAPAAGDVETPSARDFKAQAERLQTMLKNPEALATPQGLDDSPALAAMMAATQIRAASFLDSVLPKPPPSPLPALQRPWEPSATERRKWALYVAAVQDPLRIVGEIRSGGVRPETFQAVSSVYPQLIADIQQKMMERLAAYDRPLPAKQRAAIERVWGAPSPTRTALLQAAHAGNVGATNGPTPDGRQQVDAGKNAQTQAQRIEARGQQ